MIFCSINRKNLVNTSENAKRTTLLWLLENNNLYKQWASFHNFTPHLLGFKATFPLFGDLQSSLYLRNGKYHD